MWGDSCWCCCRLLWVCQQVWNGALLAHLVAQRPGPVTRRQLNLPTSLPPLQPVYAACKRLFSSLPLAARIAEATLVLHGGLFRRQPQRGGGQGKNKRKRALPLLHGELLMLKLFGRQRHSAC